MNYNEDDIKRAAGQAMRAGLEAGKSAEQERIIKLLTEADSTCSAWAIALIKAK